MALALRLGLEKAEALCVASWVKVWHIPNTFLFFNGKGGEKDGMPGLKTFTNNFWRGIEENVVIFLNGNENLNSVFLKLLCWDANKLNFELENSGAGWKDNANPVIVILWSLCPECCLNSELSARLSKWWLFLLFIQNYGVIHMS